MPKVKSIKCIKNARPGTSTAQAKWSKPVKDWISLRVTFRRLRNSEINFLHLSSLFCGSRASVSTQSNSMPAKVMVVDGPIVFSGAMGIPK